MDQTVGKDKLLDNVAYYFDAKSHGFDEIDGIDIKKFKQVLVNKIKMFKQKFDIK